jgi:putative membrane protein (TIGR04086 family)
MGKKVSSAWKGLLAGVLAAMGLYLLCQMLLAALVVRGVLPEERVFACQAAGCALSVFLGGCLAARTPGLRPVSGALGEAGIFCLTLTAAGLIAYHSIAWTGRGGVLLLSAVLGGAAAGAVSSRSRGSRTGHRRRRPRRKAAL